MFVYFVNNSVIRTRVLYVWQMFGRRAIRNAEEKIIKCYD